MAPEEIAVLEVLMKSDTPNALVAFQRIVSQCEWNRQKLVDRADTVDIKQNEIDNRRRRMELAQAILDESITCDLERIAEIVWPGQAGILTFESEVSGSYPIITHQNGQDWCTQCGRYVTDLASHGDTCSFAHRARSPRPDISKPTPIADPVTCQELGTHDFDFGATWLVDSEDGKTEWARCKRCGDERPT